MGGWLTTRPWGVVDGWWLLLNDRRSYGVAMAVGLVYMLFLLSLGTQRLQSYGGHKRGGRGPAGQPLAYLTLAQEKRQAPPPQPATVWPLTQLSLT